MCSQLRIKFWIFVCLKSAPPRFNQLAFHLRPFPLRRATQFFILLYNSEGHKCKVKLMCSLSVHDVCACRWRVFCSVLETINQSQPSASYPNKMLYYAPAQSPNSFRALSRLLSLRNANCTHTHARSHNGFVAKFIAKFNQPRETL